MYALLSIRFLKPKARPIMGLSLSNRWSDMMWPPSAGVQLSYGALLYITGRLMFVLYDDFGLVLSMIVQGSIGIISIFRSMR